MSSHRHHRCVAESTSEGAWAVLGERSASDRFPRPRPSSLSDVAAFAEFSQCHLPPNLCHQRTHTRFDRLPTLFRQGTHHLIHARHTLASSLSSQTLQMFLVPSIRPVDQAPVKRLLPPIVARHRQDRIPRWIERERQPPTPPSALKRNSFMIVYLEPFNVSASVSPRYAHTPGQERDGSKAHPTLHRKTLLTPF